MRLALDESIGKDIDEEVATHYRVLRMIWMAFVVFVVALFFVTRLLTPEPRALQVLFWVFLALGVGTLGASFIIKHTLLKQATTKRNPALIRTAYIATYALCESVALIGFIFYFFTAIQTYYVFFVLAGFGIIVHKPQRDELLAVLGHEDVWASQTPLSK